MSAPGSIAVKAAPSVSKPVVTGVHRVGKTLRAHVTVTPGFTVRYQWYRNGHAVAGATGSTYRVKGADRGKKVSVAATASGVSQTSRAVRIKK